MFSEDLVPYRHIKIIISLIIPIMLDGMGDVGIYKYKRFFLKYKVRFRGSLKLRIVGFPVFLVPSTKENI